MRATINKYAFSTLAAAKSGAEKAHDDKHTLRLRISEALFPRSAHDNYRDNGAKHGRAEKLPFMECARSSGRSLLDQLSRSKARHSVCLSVPVCAMLTWQRGSSALGCKAPNVLFALAPACGCRVHAPSSGLCKKYYVRIRESAGVSVAVFSALLSAPLRCRRSSRACYRSIINAAISFQHASQLPCLH